MDNFLSQETKHSTLNLVGNSLDRFFPSQDNYRCPYEESELAERSQSAFTADYHSARELFLARACDAGGKIESFQMVATSRRQEPLFIDFAIFSNGTPERALLHISGTHGPEAFSGSAIQSDLLSQSVEPPANSMIIFCHGLNPFGMAEYQRTNENNIDPNRNYRGSTAEFHENICTDYTALDSLIHPTNEAELLLTLELLANKTVEREDFLKKLTIFMPGQNDNPDGLFYTGQSLTQSYTLLNYFLDTSLPDAIRDLFIVDVHTGLGAFGGEMLFSQPVARLSDGSDLYQKMTHTSGLQITAPDPNADNFYDAKGDTVAGARTYLAKREIACNGICQEFGTYPFETIAATLIAENFYRAQGISRPAHALNAIKEMFNPASLEWQKSILSQGNRLYNAVMKSLFVK